MSEQKPPRSVPNTEKKTTSESSESLPENHCEQPMEEQNTYQGANIVKSENSEASEKGVSGS